MSVRRFWNRLSGPVKVGLAFALIAIVLTVVGQLRQPDSITFRSLVMGILIGGGSWGLVSWAIAYAAWDVENELAGGEDSESESADQPSTAA